MTKAMAVSMALIALALIVQFHSVTKAAVILLAVPLGLIGALTGLLLTDSPMGFMALLALVSLAGVIVSHIIVLSDYIEEGLAAGMKLETALVQAGLVRLRPVLVTVLATVGALVPLFESGGALWRPLAAVHIFGLLFATMLTLVILPVLYYLFSRVIRIIRE
jgi:multidrug efflux pump subunit AcrB